ncbi:MAG: exopolyphosphatase [Alcanivoracaceae bacterium]|nr:exopolyphosphatase [Alcanivoracaceae bacterium]
MPYSRAQQGDSPLQQQKQALAAIDLGSNSFHMVVGWLEHNEIRLQESLSEKVQLGAGLDARNQLTEEACRRALDCLARFAQRIEGIPRGYVRVVGTNTLRVARNAKAFLKQAEAVLGHDIDIVAGREEARLIYLGVSHHLPGSNGRRLVVDIGGGSTELIIGERFESVETESLHMGCVSFSGRFFADGQVTEKAFRKAVTAARQEVLSIEAAYRALGWQEAVGASGTVKAIAQVCQENGWASDGITLDGLQKIRKQILKTGAIDELAFKGLRDDRVPIFPAGVAILTGIFEQLGIEHMTVAAGALREGLLYDLLGRFAREDVRERSILAMLGRYHVDRAQAERVHDSAMLLLKQVAGDWGLDQDIYRDLLRWAALLHEIGLSVSHTQFHKHGAYLLLNSDLPGFSRQEQEMMAALVRGHRRKIPAAEFDNLAEEDRLPARRLCLLLRLATRLHHARSTDKAPEPELVARGDELTLTFPDHWLDERPLSEADFEQEQDYFGAAGITLRVH